MIGVHQQVAVSSLCRESRGWRAKTRKFFTERDSATCRARRPGETCILSAAFHTSARIFGLNRPLRGSARFRGTGRRRVAVDEAMQEPDAGVRCRAERDVCVYDEVALHPIPSFCPAKLMSRLFLCLALVVATLSFARVSAQSRPASSAGEITINENTYQGRKHYVVTTAAATYWVDHNSGGLSRMIDRDGNDWIGFKMRPWGDYPAAAAGAFRGLPNAVFQGDDGGFGHPGWDKGSTKRVDRKTLVTDSESGKWQLRWGFTDDDATVTITKADPTRKYWFLYEGTIAGRFQPHAQYFATDTLAPVTEPKDYIGGDRFHQAWKWAYFGDTSVARVLSIVHEQDDDLIDTFAHLGNDREQGLSSTDGMVVFGLGRGAKGVEPLLTGENSFRLRFIEQAGDTPAAYANLQSRLP